MIKKIIVALVLIGIAGCKSETKPEKIPQEHNQEKKQEEKKVNSDITLEDKKEEAVKLVPFNWDEVALTNEDLGEFPYFTVPKGYKYGNGARTFDVYELQFYINNHFQKFEGKVFKTNMKMTRDENGDSQRWNEIGFKKAYHEYILAKGVLLFEGVVPKKDFKKLGEQNNQYPLRHVIAGSEVYQTPIRIYAIKTANEKILVQTWANSAGGQMGVLRMEDFKQTITKITANKIKKALDEKGFISLYINFEFAKSRIKPDSYAIIDEIKILLEQHKELDISIEGHTDNVGEPDFNLKLSQRRAEAVSIALIDEGISESRLQSKGHGETKPIETNKTEEGRAKNRRVEIRKKN